MERSAHVLRVPTRRKANRSCAEPSENPTFGSATHAPPLLDNARLVEPDRIHPNRPRPSAVSPWLSYKEAAAYSGWSVAYLRNLVSSGQIPVYGKPRVRRFRLDMLDWFLTDPDAAMRRFLAERNTHGN